MPDIENYQVYNDRMRRSMWDKAFFMDKIAGTDMIIDYGCADGSLVRFLSELFPAMRFIGFDIDPVMIASANAQRGENTWFFSTMEEVIEQLARLNVTGDQCAVNFSSVFHEVFHYGFDLSLIRHFLSAIAPQYIVVRDMMYESADGSAAVSADAVRRVREMLPEEQVRSFEECFGTIGLRRNMVHFLMKYQYVENWERECAENYFSYTMEDLLPVIDSERQFRRILLGRYVLPYLRYTVEKDLKIDLGESFTTHYSMILKRYGDEPLIPVDAEDKI
ncbi:MAG: class I SAM-dependent methyltransferase [Lachnospiraceae bacterium]|nr:class I SAM-dependent methyltransferase [Lachnospiraceae bacterium]